MDFYRPPTTRGTLDALSSIYRAVRVWRFYPKGHPTRRSSLDRSYVAMQEMLDGHTLLLTCGRTGFSFPDGEFLKDTSGFTTSLAYELFIRRVQKISFLHDLYQEDLLELCKIACLTPEEIYQAGGMDTMMADRGIRSIWVNEFDLSVIRGKRQRVEESGVVPSGIDESEGTDPTPPPELQTPVSNTLSPDEQLQALLVRLATCIDDDIYLFLIRQAVACADTISQRRESYLLLPLIELLAGHATDPSRAAGQHECALFALEQIISTGDVLQVVLERTERDEDVSNNTLVAILKSGGTTAIAAVVELMGRTTSLKTRRKLATSLISLGEDAVPVLLDLMHDSRWFIVRNMCSILGAIASREALAELTTCLKHNDPRVRKEAIRGLAQIGGPGAEDAIIAILKSRDADLCPQAIISLGGMKCRRALPELMNIMFSRDLLLKSLPLKLDTLTALAVIGDQQVTPYLANLLKEHHFWAAARGRQLKSAIAACLGKLGDPRAIPALQALATRGGELGSACSEAVASIKKTEGKPDGNS